MRVLITGANSNVGRGMIPRLRAHRHFGTFLEELRLLDQELGPEGVRTLTCPYV